MDTERRDEWIDALSAIVERAEDASPDAELSLGWFDGERTPWFGNYAYVCTRCRARRSQLYGPETYDRLMRMGVSEIARFMAESAYRDEVEALGTRHRGVDLVEKALNRNLANTYREVLSWCKGRTRVLLSAYLKRWDVWNLKTVLRATFSGADVEEVRDELVPAGELDLEDLAPLLEHDTVEEVVEDLAGTEWFGPLAAGIEEALDDDEETVESLTEIENELDRYYYRTLRERVPDRRPADERFARFVREEIDLVNLRTILRLNRDGYETEEIEPLVVPGGETVVGEVLQALMAETDLEASAAVLRETELADRVPTGIDRLAEGDLSAALWAIERDHRHRASRGKNRHPLSMLPIMDFVMAKKDEVDSIRIVARGKEHQLPEERIEEQVVIRSS